MKSAVIFGATGFIGSHLLTETLQNPEYDKVTVVVRKPLKFAHPKLTVLVADFKNLESVKEQIRGDEVFIALGTTKKKTPNQKEYYEIDHDYPVLAARLAKANGANSVFIVTAVGANSNSNIFYVRTKGEVEKDICQLNFQHTHIFQPSMTLGDREEHRALESFFISLWKVVDPILLGSLKVYKGIHGQDVAKAMVMAAKKQPEKVKFYRWPEMNELLP